MKITETALTFDDVLLIPRASNVLPKDVNIATKFTKNINLNIPIISAAMDTVTESSLAIAIAEEGGIGIIHKNMSIAEQAEEAARVKRFEAGVIKNPITISPDSSVNDVLALQKKHNISALPVVKNTKIIGIITARDLRFQTDMKLNVGDIMTTDLITVKPNTDITTIKALLHNNKIERVLVVDDTGSLKGMITVRDILKSSSYPHASKDSEGRLRVGAAVGVGDDSLKRIDALVAVNVDVVVIDTAHGHSSGVISMVERTKTKYPTLEVIAGNIATAQAAKDLIAAGADAVKAGIGPGSICTTRIVAGVGVPQISAISNIADALVGTGIPLIADGGIRYSGDIAKAFVAGASSVMLGSILAGTKESPGEVELYQGRSYKSYRGMGSLGAMSARYGSSDRYFQESIQTDKLVPEGIEGRVPFKGSIRPILHQMIGGVRSSMGYLGCKTLSEMYQYGEFVQVSTAGMRESHVHDVNITKEAPNYHS